MARRADLNPNQGTLFDLSFFDTGNSRKDDDERSSERTRTHEPKLGELEARPEVDRSLLEPEASARASENVPNQSASDGRRNSRGLADSRGNANGDRRGGDVRGDLGRGHTDPDDSDEQRAADRSNGEPSEQSVRENRSRDTPRDGDTSKREIRRSPSSGSANSENEPHGHDDVANRLEASGVVRGSERHQPEDVGATVAGHGTAVPERDSPAVDDTDAGLGAGSADRNDARALLYGEEVSAESDATLATDNRDRSQDWHSDDLVVPRGSKARAHANLAAIDLLHELGENPATRDQQEVLAAWSGWGGLAPIFDPRREDWKAEQDRLQSLLSQDDVEAAAKGVLNAHYTNPNYVQPIWAALKRLGLEDARLIEPGCGSGNFIGAAPDDVSMVGVELDSMTAAIVAKLYPSAEILHESFAETSMGNTYFDGAIGNVPFGDIKLHDPAYNPGHHSIHNHFIVKSLAMTRPGGMVAVLSSSWTLDAKNPSARRDIYSSADLVGAVRLPTGAHREAASTDALTDVLIFRKRLPDETPQPFTWEHSRLHDFEGGRAPLNSYYEDHPERVLGQMRVAHGMYNAETLQVVNRDLETVGDQLTDALTVVTDEGRAKGLIVTDTPPEALTPVRLEKPSRDVGQIEALDDGTFMVLRSSGPEPLEVPKKHQQELRAMLDLRDKTRSLLALEEASREDTPQLVSARGATREAYQSFTQRFGGLNRQNEYQARVKNQEGEWTKELRFKDRPAARLFRQDPYSAMTMAIEVWDQADEIGIPAPLLSSRQIGAHYIPSGAETITDAMAISREQRGHLDVDYMAHLLDERPEQVTESLTGIAFQDPQNDETWVTRAEYLSGNVVAKLADAKEASKQEPARWAANVSELQAHQPEPITLDQVEISPGAPWIPQDVTREFFLNEIIDHDPRFDRGSPVCVVDPHTWSWKVQLQGATTSAQAHRRWNADVARRQPYALWEAVLNNRTVIISDKQDDGSDVVDAVATEAAHTVMEEMRDAYSEFIWEKPERVRTLTERYNAMFNTVVPRDYTEDGKMLRFPGLASSVHPYEHQPAAVARMINEPAVGLFHEVGAGKTKSMIMGAMEMKRLGIISKPIVVVPNHMLFQFSNEWLQTYPNARILVATEGASAQERRQLVAKATMSDWDGIVMTQENFKALAVSDETKAAYIRGEITKYRETIELSENSNMSVRRLETAVEKMENQLRAITDHPTDSGITFEAMGIDYIIADEAHAYKNLSVSTNLQGVGPSTSSGRAADMKMKMDYLRGKFDHVGTFATATPIANTISEAHTMMTYLRPDLLAERGILPFDAFAATFCQASTKAELNVVGDYRMKTRIARFQNLPEFLSLWGIPADVKTAADLNLDVPLIEPNDDGLRVPRVISIDGGTEMDAWNADIAARNEAIANGLVDPTTDNMLRLSTHGRQAALDLRLVGRTPGTDTKTERAAEEIYRIWDATKDNVYKGAGGKASPRTGALQMVFCDMSTPKNTGEWDAYHALKNALVERGIDSGTIRFMHEANTDGKKEELFKQARSGDISVLIGSTAKMGVGTNIQDRAIAMHHLDAPWRPADVSQRDGRIVRKGNQNNEVEIIRYVTEKSFDSYMWQTLERKQSFISQVITGRVSERSVEDIGDTTMTFAQVKAIATGDPDILERTDIEANKRRYERLLTAHNRKVHQLTSDATLANLRADHAQRRIDRLTPIVENLQPVDGDNFTVTVGIESRFGTSRPRTFTERKAAAQYFSEVFTREYQGQIDRVAHLRPGGTASYLPGGATRITLAGVHLKVSEMTRPLKGNDVTVGFTVEEVEETHEKIDPIRVPLSTIKAGEPGLMVRLSNGVNNLAALVHSAEDAVPRLRVEAAETAHEAQQSFPHADQLADSTRKLAAIDARIARRGMEKTLAAGVRFPDHTGFYARYTEWPAWTGTSVDDVQSPLTPGQSFDDLEYAARYRSEEGEWRVWAAGRDGKAVGLIRMKNEPDQWGVFDLLELETAVDPLSNAPGLIPRPAVIRIDVTDDGNGAGEGESHWPTPDKPEGYIEEPIVLWDGTGQDPAGILTVLESSQTDHTLQTVSVVATPEAMNGALRTAMTAIPFTNSFTGAEAALAVAAYTDGTIVTALPRELNVYIPDENRNRLSPGEKAAVYVDRQGTDGRGWLRGNGRYVRALLGQEDFPDDVAYCDSIDPDWRTPNVTVTHTELRPVRMPDGVAQYQAVSIDDPDEDAQRRPTSERDMPETTPMNEKLKDVMNSLGEAKLSTSTSTVKPAVTTSLSEMIRKHEGRSR